MNIAVDLDEVLVDFIISFLKDYNEKNKTFHKKADIKNYYFHDLLGIGEKEYLQIISDTLLNNDKILPTKNSQLAISKLKDNHNLFIVTSRNLELKERTLNWVNQHFPNNFKEIYFCSKNLLDKKEIIPKSEICKKIKADIMIEDTLSHAEDCAKVVKNVFLIDAPWNQSQKLPSNIKRVFSWGEILKEINAE